MAEESTATPEKKAATGNKKSLLIIIIAAVVLVVVAGAAAWFFLSGKKEHAPEAKDAGTHAAKEEKKPKLDKEGKPLPPLGPLVEVKEFVLNISSKGENHFLKAGMSLEVDNTEVAGEIGQRLPQIQDIILLHVGSKTLDELSDLQGKLQLRAELIAKLNSVLEKGRVNNIFFTTFVLQ